MPVAPLPLRLSWPLYESRSRFSLGNLRNLDDLAGGRPDDVPPAGPADLGVGKWSCDLRTEALSWSLPVYALFGFPPDATPTRSETVARYAEHSRAKMERLRAYAIRHRRGFTLDAEIRPVAGGGLRFMRLIAAPILQAERPIALHGIKMDVTDEYR